MNIHKEAIKKKKEKEKEPLWNIQTEKNGLGTEKRKTLLWHKNKRLNEERYTEDIFSCK